METMNTYYSPYIGENGNWYVSNEDTGVKAQGPEGPQGPIGPKGETGDRGSQGVQGPMGNTGLQGPKGDKGNQGTAGPQGAVGPQGEAGPQGVAGSQGEAGPQGVAGPQGATGPQGVAGPQGATGPQGVVGPRGATGPQGAKGDTPTLVANLSETTAGKALDATMGKVLNDNVTRVYSNFAHYTPLGPTQQTGSTNFINGVSGSMSACKIGLLVIVTVKINVADNYAGGRLLFNDNPLSNFGTPRFDYVNTLKCMLDHRYTGCLYVNGRDSRLYFLTPKAGTYYGELIYVTDN